MARRGVRWAALLALVMSFWVGFTVSASAATEYYVRTGGNDTNCDGQTNVDYNGSNSPNCAFATLATAVAAASSGDTVSVAPGDYTGSTTITKELTLLGAQAGIDARTRSGSDESSIGGLFIRASNVKIDGFTFDGVSVDVSSPDSSILSNVRIANNIFTGYTSVGLPTNAAGNITITQNVFKDAAPKSEPMQIKSSGHVGGCSYTVVLNNAFINATNNGSADVNFSCTGSDSSTVAVVGNTTTGNSDGSSFVAFSGVTDEIIVSNNSGTTSGSAIYFFGEVSGTAEITGNVFTDGGSNAVSINAEPLVEGPANTGTFIITGNRFSENAGGIFIGEGALGTGGQVQAHFNEITYTGSDGVSNATSTTIDATNNWWGCNTGPNTSGCDRTQGPVTFDPWLTLTISADPSTISPQGYPGSSSTITASLTINSDNVDTSSAGHVYDGTPIDFLTTDGLLLPASGTTTSGMASTTLFSTSVPSSAEVKATLDAQTVVTTVDWTIPASSNGAHITAINRSDPWLLLDVMDTSRGARGLLFYVGNDHSLLFGVQFTTVAVSGNEAGIDGLGIVFDRTGIHLVSFHISITASDTSPGGTIEIQTSTGYDSGVIPISMLRL